MELFDEIKFDIVDKQSARQMSPQVLAYIGDAVHSLYVRVSLSLSHDLKSGGLHELSKKEVSAVAQSKKLEALFDSLSAEEQEIFKIGRNTKINNVAKNASLAEYKKSTGFECLLGYLFLTGQNLRILELIR